MLTSADQQALEDLAALECFGSQSEVVAHGIHLARLEQAQEAAKLEWLRAEAQKGWDDFDAGRYTDITTDEQLASFMAGIRAEVMAKHQARQAQEAKAS